MSLKEHQLRQPPFQCGLAYVTRQLDDNQLGDRHPGALGHALSVYKQRVLGVKPGHRRERLAQNSQ